MQVVLSLQLRIRYAGGMRKTATAGVLVDLLAPVVSALNDEAARKLIGLRADRKVQAHVGRLARKCNEGELTADERSEYEAFVAVGDFVAILQALARRRLRERAM